MDKFDGEDRNTVDYFSVRPFLAGDKSIRVVLFSYIRHRPVTHSTSAILPVVRRAPILRTAAQVVPDLKVDAALHKISRSPGMG